MSSKEIPTILSIIDTALDGPDVIKKHITFLEIAEKRNPALAGQELINGDDLAKVGIPVLTSCWRCGATLGAYNAYVRISHIEDDSPSCWDCLA